MAFIEDLEINYDSREVRLAGQAMELTATEYGLIRELSAAEGRPLTYKQLLRRVWRNSHFYDPRVVRTHVGRLRRKLGHNGENPTYILTEPRVGYRMAQSANSGPPKEGPTATPSAGGSCSRRRPAHVA